MQITKAIKIIRKELLIKDEPVKAYNLVKAVNLPELEKELKYSYGLVRHVFEPEEYKKSYENLDLGNFDPEQYCMKAELIYARYGWILRKMEEEKATSLLDLGCYVGSLVLTAASRGYTATGVDMTKKAIEVANDRKNKFDIKKASFYCEDATEFNTVKADAVFASEIIEHVPDPERYVRHLASLSTGWVYVTTPNGPFMDGEGNRHHWEWDGGGTRGHVRVFTPATIKKLLKEYEIKELREEDDGLLWVQYRKTS